MLLFGRKMLGLAIEERTILVAEVNLSGGPATVRCAAELKLPEGVSLDDPKRLGQEVRGFLRQHHFSSRDAVIGVPARWLLSKEKVFPPAVPKSLAGMVRIEAERSFATDLDRLMIDYANGLAIERGVPVFLTAIARERVDPLLAVSQAAGLKTKALVPTSMALANAMRPKGASEIMLFLRPHHAEAVIRSAGGFRAVRHLSLPSGSTGLGQEEGNSDWGRALSESVARLAALAPREEGDAVAMGLVIWNGMDASAEILEGVGTSLGMGVSLRATLADLGLASAGSKGTDGKERFAGAAALALTGARGEKFPVDFLHSRLSVRERPRLRGRIAWAAATAAAICVGCIAVLVQWRQEERDLTALQERLSVMKPDIDDARAVVERVGLARGWTDRKPRFLETLREITLAFPAEGRIWVTNIAVREDMRVLITGKSADEQSVLELLDRLQGNPSFATVRPLYLREAGGNTREIAFSMTLDFVGRE